MTQNLTKNLINLSDRGLGANRPAELAFNHAEGGLNIRPLMVMWYRMDLMDTKVG